MNSRPLAIVPFVLVLASCNKREDYCYRVDQFKQAYCYRSHEDCADARAKHHGGVDGVTTCEASKDVACVDFKAPSWSYRACLPSLDDCFVYQHQVTEAELGRAEVITKCSTDIHPVAIDRNGLMSL